MSERKITSPLKKDSAQAVHQYAAVLARGVKESKLPWHQRVWSSTQGWGSTTAINLAGIHVDVGYREPRLNWAFSGPIIKHGWNPPYGIRFGHSDRVYERGSKLKRKLEKFGEDHARDSLAPVLYELARQKGRLSDVTIDLADRLGAQTSTTVTAINQATGEHHTHGVLFIPDRKSEKMVRFDFLQNKHEPSQADIAVAKGLLNHQMVQSVFALLPEQAVRIDQSVANDVRSLHIRGEAGSHWLVEMPLSVVPPTPPGEGSEAAVLREPRFSIISQPSEDVEKALIKRRRKERPRVEFDMWTDRKGVRYFKGTDMNTHRSRSDVVDFSDATFLRYARSDSDVAQGHTWKIDNPEDKGKNKRRRIAFRRKRAAVLPYYTTVTEPGFVFLNPSGFATGAQAVDILQRDPQLRQRIEESGVQQAEPTLIQLQSGAWVPYRIGVDRVVNKVKEH